MMTGGFILAESFLLQDFLGQSVAAGGQNQKRLMRQKY